MATTAGQGMHARSAIDEFFAGREWSSEGPAHHHQILTVFGLYGRPAGTVIPVAAIVRLLAELDAESSSVRSSISRLKTKGVLVGRKIATGNGYALIKDLEPYMQAGDARIFTGHSAAIGDPWLLVSFSVPESERQYRHRIRTGLARMGFGHVAAGLYIGPARLQADVIEYTRQHRLQDYVELFVGAPAAHGDIRAKVARWWDLDALATEYQSFIDTYQRDLDSWRARIRKGSGTPADAFRHYVPMLTHWRRLPFRDPGLPLELLPPDWAGRRARKMFDDLNRLQQPLAARHFDDVVNERV